MTHVRPGLVSFAIGVLVAGILHVMENGQVARLFEVSAIGLAFLGLVHAGFASIPSVADWWKNGGIPVLFEPYESRKGNGDD